MKKILVVLSFGVVFGYAQEAVTKEDMKIYMQQMDKRFEQVDKRLEQIDKRYEDMKQHSDKRFEQIDKRFEDMKQHSDKRFEQIDKRFEDMGQHSDKRFEEMNSKFNILLTIMLSGFTLVMGYLIKERNSIKRDMKTEIEPELIKKADKSTMEKIIAVIEEMAKKDKDIEDMLSRHHLRLA